MTWKRITVWALKGVGMMQLYFAPVFLGSALSAHFNNTTKVNPFLFFGGVFFSVNLFIFLLFMIIGWWQYKR